MNESETDASYRESELYGQRHGLFIGVERIGEAFFLSLKARGKLSARDYQLIKPIIDSALLGIDREEMRLLIDGSEIDSWQAGALWADLKLGLKHRHVFSRVAVVGDKRWLRLIGRMGGWLGSGQTRHFPALSEALDWLVESS